MVMWDSFRQERLKKTEKDICGKLKQLDNNCISNINFIKTGGWSLEAGLQTRQDDVLQECVLSLQTAHRRVSNAMLKLVCNGELVCST